MFYIEIDLKSSEYFIFPFIQPREMRYLIKVNTKYEAEDILRKLKSKTLKPPPEETDFKRGEVRDFNGLEFQSFLRIAR